MQSHLVLLVVVVLASCDRSRARAPSDERERLPSSEVTASDAVVAEPDVSEGSTGVDGPTFPKLGVEGHAAPKVADFTITLERTACFGWCPMYEVVVTGDGNVKYTGSKFVVREGEVNARIEPARLVPILQELEGFDVWNRAHTCDSVIMDTPSTVVTLRLGDRVRELRDAFNGRSCSDADAEKAAWHRTIDRIGEMVDEVAHTEQWIGTEEQRKERFMSQR